MITPERRAPVVECLEDLATPDVITDAVLWQECHAETTRITDYRSLSAYMKRIRETDGISSTVNIHHIKAGYYSIRALNPTGIVAPGPV